jgi:hypothetical protein
LVVYLELSGIWDDVLQDLLEDPHGPQIDLREELVAQLGQRVTVVSDYELPITPTSQRLLFAIETDNAERVAAAITKTLKNDAEPRKFEDYTIWEMVEEKESEIPTVTVDDLPSLTPGPVPEPEPQQEETRLLPHAAVTVAHDHLFVASHMDFLLKVLKPAEPRETLGSSVDYEAVAVAFEHLGTSRTSLRMFSRTDEEYRSTYELIRQGKMPESESILGRLLNALFNQDDKKTMRQQKIDGSQLPDYEVVRRSLGPAGLIVTSESDGWFIKGFTLPKGSQ